MRDKSITVRRKQRFLISHSMRPGSITFKLNRFPFHVLASNESKEMDLPWLVNNIIGHNRVCSNRSIGPTCVSAECVFMCTCLWRCASAKPLRLKAAFIKSN